MNHKGYIALAGLLAALSTSTLAASFTVEVNGLTSYEGQLMISVYNSEDTWLTPESVARKKVKLGNESDPEIRFDLPEGEYAISIIHDENSNDELDTNWIGIPNEAVGNSGKLVKRMGPPLYETSTFTLTESTKIVTVKMAKP